jgi:DNA/RNA endonuclease YhcR with UshA esterase domain
MKTFAYILLAFTAVIASSCSKDNSGTTTAQKSNLSSGAWTVSYFTDSGKDETSDFSGYSFSFNTGGTLTVTGAGTTFNGTWSIKSGSSSGGYGSSDPDKLIITISGDKQMDKVSKSWQIVKLNSTQIWLSDDNPSSAEVLYFAR